MLDGCHGVGLAFIRSARVVLGPGRALSSKGSATSKPVRRTPVGRRIEDSSADQEAQALRDAKTRQAGSRSLDPEGNHGAGQQSGFQGRVQTEPGPPGEPRLRLKRYASRGSRE